MNEKVSPENLEERRLKLEEAKFAFEKEKFEREKSRKGLSAFLKNNLAVVVSAIVSLATITVSYLQFQISQHMSQAQMNLEKKKFDNSKELDARNFAFEFSKFLMEKEAEFNTLDIGKAKYLRNVVMVGMPNNLGFSISRSMADNAPSDEIRLVWQDSSANFLLKAKPPSHQGTTQLKNLTIDDIVKAFPQMQDDKPYKRLSVLFDAATKAGIQDRRRLATMIAFILSETNFFTRTEEDLNYSAEQLLATWPFRVTKDEAAKLAHNSEAIANKVYANRMGNTKPDDGWRYRGRGYLGTTGRASYENSGRLTGADLVANPDILSKDDSVAAQEAIKIIMQNSFDLDDIRILTHRLNGGLNGLANSQMILQRLLPEDAQASKELVNQNN